MIIIIEGPDGAGKTTLAKYLNEGFNIPVLHRTKPKDEEEKKTMMRGYLDDIQEQRSIVWDRCWYSEMVYGPIMRDKSWISVKEMWDLERSMGKALIIYCTGNVNTLWQRCKERGEDYIMSKEQLAKIKNGFDELFYDTYHFIPVVTYDATKMSQLWVDSSIELFTE